MADFDQHKQISDGAAAAAMLPHVRAETDHMEDGIINRAIMAVQKQTLTPEQALAAWQELALLRRLLKSFEARVTIGNSVAEELGSALDPQGVRHGS